MECPTKIKEMAKKHSPSSQKYKKENNVYSYRGKRHIILFGNLYRIPLYKNSKQTFFESTCRSINQFVIKKL